MKCKNIHCIYGVEIMYINLNVQLRNSVGSHSGSPLRIVRLLKVAGADFASSLSHTKRRFSHQSSE